MKLKTAITTFENGKEIIRGHELEKLIQEKSFIEVIFLLFTGVLPSKEEVAMLNALLVSAIDHGADTPSAIAARTSATKNKSIHTALADGILGFSPQHGIAGEPAMEFFYSYVDKPNILEVLKKLKEDGVRVPGYGHRIFTDSDPRSETLFDIAKEQGIFGKYCEFALRVKEELNSISSKQLPLNIDGTFAAILCDMGFEPAFGQIFFLISRTPGLLAHIKEEKENSEN